MADVVAAADARSAMLSYLTGAFDGSIATLYCSTLHSCYALESTMNYAFTIVEMSISRFSRLHSIKLFFKTQYSGRQNLSLAVQSPLCRVSSDNIDKDQITLNISGNILSWVRVTARNETTTWPAKHDLN